ncbi:hypothetical protein, partial [Clostridium sp.]|uniref:hypothetical protein n=1 Tax=Clostridium sp. TaxID=1506 RepID=UPI0026319DEF
MKNIRRTFLLLIIFTVIGYLEYALVSFFSGIGIDYSYTRYDLNISPVGVLFRFGKEVMLLLLIVQILYYFFKNINNISIKSFRSITYIFTIGLIILEGIISGMFSGNSFVSLFLSGIRGIIYLTAVVVFSLEFNSKDFYLKVCKVLDWLFVTQFTIIVLQAIQLAIQFGVSSLVEMRVCGT